MNELERKIDAVLDAGEPASRLQELRATLERLQARTKLPAERMAEYSGQIAKLLDQAARLAPYTGTRWHDAHLRLDEADQLLMLASLEPRIVRDNKRQAGTKAPRFPECDEWMDAQLRRQPDAKAPDLWKRAPDWISDRLAYDRFSKRVTAARKRKRAASK